MKSQVTFIIFFLFISGVFAQKRPGSGSSVYNSVSGDESFPGYLFPDTVNIAEIEVVAERKLEETGMHISRPDSLALSSGMTVDLSDLLSRYTPVFIKSYGPGAQATANFRGTSASHSQIIWNGIRLNSPMRGYTDLSQLPLFFIDNVYLLHGGSSLLTGSGALGGTIHLDNFPGWREHFALKGITEQASFLTRRYMGMLKVSSSALQSVTRGYTESSANDFPFYNTAVLPKRRDRLQNGDYRKNAWLQEFYFRTKRNVTFNLRGWYQQNYRNLPPLMSYEGQIRSEYMKDTQLRLQSGIKKYSEKADFQYLSGFNFSGMNYSLSTGQEKYIINDALSREKSLHNLFRTDVRFPGLILSGSAEVSWIQVESDDKVKKDGYNKHRFESGVFFSVRYKPSGRTGLFLLSRTEYYDGKLIPFIPSAGGDWQISAKLPLLLKLSLSRNFHKPGLNDLYWNPGGNPGLIAEKGNTGELMLSFPLKKKKISLDQEISFYVSSVKNWIMWQPSSNGAWYWEAVNLDKVASHGLEYDFSGSSELNRWYLNLTGNYALTRTFRTGPGQQGKDQLIYIPVHSGNLHVSVTKAEWSLMTGASYTGRRYTQTSEQEGRITKSLDPFWFTYISLQRNFAFGAVQGGIKIKTDNLLNASYQQILWRPMPLRSFSVTVTITYKT